MISFYVTEFIKKVSISVAEDEGTMPALCTLSNTAQTAVL